MVNSEKIKNDYLQLVQMIEKEVSNNSSIRPYLIYLNGYKDKFVDQNKLTHTQDLREFLIGANRYADEFSFTNQNGAQIRALTNDLYETLNRS